MWQTILTAAITCGVTLTVTLAFNTIVNAPKKQRKQREDEAKARQAELEKISAEMQGIRGDLKEEVTKTHEDLSFVKAGLQAVLKNELKVRYFKWLDLGYAPEDAKEDLERMYTAYHNLGANGVMDKHRERFLNLPDRPLKGGGAHERMD